MRNREWVGIRCRIPPGRSKASRDEHLCDRSKGAVGPRDLLRNHVRCLFLGGCFQGDAIGAGDHASRGELERLRHTRSDGPVLSAYRGMTLRLDEVPQQSRGLPASVQERDTRLERALERSP